MGGECHMGAPTVGWGYWHDAQDRNGDHRFDWAIAGDPVGSEMRRLVSTINHARWQNPALRSDTLIITHEDHDHQILAFKQRLLRAGHAGRRPHLQQLAEMECRDVSTEVALDVLLAVPF